MSFARQRPTEDGASTSNAGASAPLFNVAAPPGWRRRSGAEAHALHVLRGTGSRSSALHGCVCIVLIALVSSRAAEPDVSKLPPAAGVTVDFDRDVRPIFEKSCFQCHGPEKPKSRFRLDNREPALKGGSSNSDDIVPGDSAKSRLIHYVAGLVEDLQMPPPGKAPALTKEQVGVLRAWIDQGAWWGGTNRSRLSFSISPMARWVDVDGDASKFREVEGFREGFGGGIEQFSLQEQISPDTRFTVDGHALFPGHDYRVDLALRKTDVGFVRAGFEQWRRYYDDTGGFHPLLSPASFDLDRNLYLDIGRAWIDFGLTLPDRPSVVLGYEFQFREGEKSMLEWGYANGKNIYPAAKAVDEQTHILKLDVRHEAGGWLLEDNARVSFYRNRTRDEQITTYTAGPSPDSTILTRQNFDHVQGANVFRAQKQLRDWWLFSGGYLYSRLSGDSSLNQVTVDAANSPVFGYVWSDRVTLRRDAHTFSLASLFLPADGFSISLGVQGELAHQEGFGTVDWAFGDADDPLSIFPQPYAARSDIDQTRTSQTALLRYTKIPFTVLFAEARASQDCLDHFEELGSTNEVFLRDTDFLNHTEDVRAGFSVSPWRWVVLSAHLRRRDSASDYDHLQDTNTTTGPVAGYSAFLREREMTTDEAEAKLVLRPRAWLKTTFTYQWRESDFRVATDPINDPSYGGEVTPGGGIQAGTHRANVYGANVTFTPWARLYCSSTFTYSESRTVTWARSDIPSVIAPYAGETFSVLASANYALNAKTALQGSYSFSRADYAQANVTDGLPLGLDYTRHGVAVGMTRQLTSCISSSVRYGFYRYREPGTGGGNDFTAHGVFVMLGIRWP